MISKLGKILLKIFGSRNERLVKAYSVIARQASQFEQQVSALDNDALKAKTAEFKNRIKSGARPEDILPEAFAVVREAAKRNVGMRHFDVQLIGGHVLYDGKIAEMATGEGKTLVATLAAYLVHLTGRKVHIVTVNDYLAKRDAEWMGPIYTALGLSVGAIQADMDTVGEERRNQYNCDITYGTNNEFGFDYLRDNMKISLEQMVQGPLEYAIIDEVDSILIDEARTPLIISGPAYDDVDRYKKADQVARKLISLQSGYDRLKKQIDIAQLRIANAQGEIAEAKQVKDQNRIKKAEKVIEQCEAEIADAQNRLTGMTQYYEVEYDRKAVHLTHEGISAAQEAAGVGSFFTGANMEWPHLIEQSLRAHVVYEKEKDYVVMDGKVIIVDEFTGRLMHGRQWSDGLHQAVEAKEGVAIKEETQTLATITLQNFFKLYDKIAGMTGTAATEAEEFMKIYKLEVVVIPTNKPCIRKDLDDVIYKTMREKFKAIIEEINRISSAGRPVLVGTISIEKSEALSEALMHEYGIEHEVLNAKQHAREAAIIAKAGQQHTGRDGSIRGNVTIATNMAGRGTDIKLGPGVADIGGLHILGTERHEARRIDNQLRGRAGRQGDAGSSQFFLSFDDDLMQFFGGDRIPKLLRLVGWEENQPIYHPTISRQIAKVQKKVEERNFEIRKNLLEYDEVMDYQRRIFYTRRRQILGGKGLKAIIEQMLANTITKHCDTILDKSYPCKCIIEWTRANFGIELKLSDIEDLEVNEIIELIKQQAKDETANEISLSIGEYLEDYEDRQTWDATGLSKWAMSAFRVNLSPSKIKEMEPEEIERQLTAAAAEQVDKKDCSQIYEFLKEDFPFRIIAEWANAKFDIKLDAAQLKTLNASQIKQLLNEQTSAKYRQREIEYPVEFAMNMVYGQQEPNIYAFEALVNWAKRKYEANLSIEQVQEASPRKLYGQLLELSRSYYDGKLEQEIDSSLARLSLPELTAWANSRFNASLNEQMLAGEQADRKKILLNAAREFLRSELSDLEKYVLVQVHDSMWKDHLYAMDHLKESIHFRAFAEKDPKVEYKREGFRMFQEMLDNIEDRVTDIIFKVRLESGARARSVWQVSRIVHDEVGQFAMAERQRAAAQTPQGEATKVKQIVLEKPKVGRNDPCPCGSGKKYKKCHGMGS
jgi:preprotein translocase subunit SecA